MEATTTRYRSTETRHGGAVGWFVGHFGGRHKQEARGHDGLDLFSSFHHGHAPVRSVNSVRKKTAPAPLEQAELWPAHQDAAVALAHAEPELLAMEHRTIEVQTLAEPVTISESKAKVQPVLARARSLSRKIIVAAQAERPAVIKPARMIARFLKVTGAIEGLQGDGGIRFDVPVRPLSNTLRLWKGSNISSDYTPVYF